MQMQQRLGLKLAQKPVLTQSLRQLVKLLALNKVDLKEEINQELVENPVLEIGLEGPAPAEGQEPDELEGEAAEQVAEASGDAPSGEGPGDAFKEIDLAAFYEDYLDPGTGPPAQEVFERPSFETFLPSPTTLTDHLLWQLSLAPESEVVLEAAEAIIGNLNDDGYLVSPVEEVCEGLLANVEEQAAALAIVQHFDPVGVGARDLLDCLLIQLRSAQEDDDIAGAIVREAWDLLEGQASTKEIAKRVEEKVEDVEYGLEIIRSLDPKPGQRYSGSAARAVEPDVEFVKVTDGFRVVLNDDDMPELRLNRSYRSLLKRGQSDADVRNYVRDRYNSAVQLLRNIEQRRQTIRGVCDAIVRRQNRFLAEGVEHLRPMMIKEVAEEIGVHPSTVSRAVANKYALTPHGVYELRFFFSEGVQGPSGDSIPLILLKRKVKRMIDEEDPRNPLTDDKLSQLLREDGVHVTRRTVAKYREDLNIPSTHKRRKKGKDGGV